MGTGVWPTPAATADCAGWTQSCRSFTGRAGTPPSAWRVRSWVAQEVHVEGRPEWVFVKVHTHGAPEANARSLLGAPGRALHEALRRYNDGHAWRLHYVTAREMYNVAMAAM